MGAEWQSWPGFGLDENLLCDEVRLVDPYGSTAVKELVPNLLLYRNAEVLQLDRDRSSVDGFEEAIAELALDGEARTDDAAREVLERVSLARELVW